jgi:hypothetical protein
VAVAVVVSGSGCASGELKLIGAAGGDGLAGKDAADDLDPAGLAAPKGDGAPLELTGLDLYEDGLAAGFADNGGERDGDGRARCADANTDAGRRPEVRGRGTREAHLEIKGGQGAVGGRGDASHDTGEDSVAQAHGCRLANGDRGQGASHGAPADGKAGKISHLG